MRETRYPVESAESWFGTARELMDAGKGLDAIRCVENAVELAPDNPAYVSLLGLLIARERGQLKRGLELAHQAVEQGERDPDLCLNLASIYVKADRRDEAVRWIDAGLERSPGHEGLMQQRVALGIRRPPVLRFLPRAHPVNKMLGLMAARLGLR